MVQETKLIHKGMLVGIRTLEIFCMGALITGFIWATSDWLTMTVLVHAPVTPLSILLMLYGTMGIFLCEVMVRLFQRAEKRFLQQK